MIRLALAMSAAFALGVYACPVIADTSHDLSGTVVRIAPTDEPGAVAQVEMHNAPHNNERNDGSFNLTMGGVSVIVTFKWDAKGSADRISVETDAAHFAWPESIDVHEGKSGVLHIFPREGIGM